MATRSFLEDEKKKKERTNATSVAVNAQQAVARTSAEIMEEHPFKWMNAWIIRLPMWSRFTIKQESVVHRNDTLNKICLGVVVSLILLLWCWYVVTAFVLHGASLFGIVWALSFSLMNIATLMSVYYHWHYFAFYGLTEEARQRIQPSAPDNAASVISTVYLDASGFRQSEYHSLTKQFSLRMKIILGVAVGSLLSIRIFLTIWKLFDPTASFHLIEYINIGFDLLAVYMYDVPLFLAQFALSVEYCRGCLFVSSLIHTIDKSLNIDFKLFIGEYHAFRDKFLKRIAVLEKVIIFRCAAQVFYLWVNITVIFEHKEWFLIAESVLWTVIGLLPFVELVFAGNATTASFHELTNKLNDIGTGSSKYGQFFDDNDNSMNHSAYLFSVIYVQRYPFLIRVFATEVSFRNAMKIAAAFALARVLQHLYEENVL